MGNTNKGVQNMEHMIAWKVYKKSDGALIDTVYYQPTFEADEVFEAIEDDYDFEILIALDEAE